MSVNPNLSGYPDHYGPRILGATRGGHVIDSGKKFKAKFTSRICFVTAIV